MKIKVAVMQQVTMINHDEIIALTFFCWIWDLRSVMKPLCVLDLILQKKKDPHFGINYIDENHCAICLQCGVPTS